MERAARSVRYVAESRYSKRDAIAWARTQRNWPSRRWRVEAGGGLKSRLLGRVAAERARRRFGGTIVEIIPTKSKAAGK